MQKSHFLSFGCSGCGHISPCFSSNAEVANLAVTITQPLIDLTCKGAPFIWHNEQDSNDRPWRRGRKFLLIRSQSPSRSQGRWAVFAEIVYDDGAIKVAWTGYRDSQGNDAGVSERHRVIFFSIRAQLP